MNISSILITLVGIIIIIALYVLSRIGQSKLPNKETSLLPDIKDDHGDVFTSVLDDIPASDGISPVIRKPTESEPTERQTLVLFISADNGATLDGNLIKKSLIKNGLSLGDNDIYHYFIKNTDESVSLFRVANGVEPWTLTTADLENKQLVGLSLVMLLPTIIDNKVALKTFIEKADSIAQQSHGTIKNQQQQILTNKDRAKMFGA